VLNISGWCSLYVPMRSVRIYQPYRHAARNDVWDIDCSVLDCHTHERERVKVRIEMSGQQMCPTGQEVWMSQGEVK
jgi:hypothetical protein